MKLFIIIWSSLAFATGAYGLYINFPSAFIDGYGELTVGTPILFAWAMWMGRKYSDPGPMHVPYAVQLSCLLAIVGCGSIGFGISWLATYLIAPATLLLLRELKPELATGRVFLLLFLAPTSHLIDLRYGESLQIATATSSAIFTQLFDPTLGTQTGNVLWCEPHRIIVTSACSGARFALRMIALALFVTGLKRSHPRIVAWLVLFGFILAIVTNTARIGVLCLAAPDYPANNLPGLEYYHDVSGVISFMIAYAILAWTNSRLSAIYLDPNKAA